MMMNTKMDTATSRNVFPSDTTAQQRRQARHQLGHCRRVPPPTPQPPPNPLPKVKLQFLVLGAAGAGKTSILRRYFYHTFESGTRLPTVGSDMYTGRMSLSLQSSSDQSLSNEIPAAEMTFNEQSRTKPEFVVEDPVAELSGADSRSRDRSNGDHHFNKPLPLPHRPTAGESRSSNNINQRNKDDVVIQMQLWDTPGRERFREQHHNKIKYTSAAHLSPSFFRNADGIMLVYDMTSSTSFTQLLKWYADVLDLYKDDPRPILIVANKLDIFQAEQERRRLTPTLTNTISNKEDGYSPGRHRVPQRSVLGLSGKNFNGKDFRYEYQVLPVTRPANNPSAEGLTTTKKGHNRADQQQRQEISSYLPNRDNWTTDGSYLESLLHSEDESHPDRDMVLLWCLRHGLTHVEVSAATGQGINLAIEELVRLALPYHSQTKGNGASHEKATTPLLQPSSNSESPSKSLHRRNEKLDLHARYASQDDTCKFILKHLLFSFNK